MNHECPCQSGSLFLDCCRPLLTNKKRAATAELLMRSRYTAYTLSDWKYIFKTWHKNTRPSLAELRSGSGSSVEWLNLKVIRTESGLSGDSSGVVEFIATYQENKNSPPQQIKETSQFIYENEQWFYVNGKS